MKDMLPILNTIVTTFFAIINAYTLFYIVIGMFKTRTFTSTQKQFRYAVLIPARNEERVIRHLIDSIKSQTYPTDLVTIFVVADNCDDQTARIARESGAIVYERFDKLNQTKGYALRYLFQQIEVNFGITSFDGYFVFDADNLLKADYIEKMNDAFASGAKVITSFRNSKNIDTNILSGMNSMHFLRTNRFSHRPRSYLRLSTIVQGTGFLFSSELVKDGWNYVDLTEDRSFSVAALLQGHKVTYCDSAEFYDEQPTNLKMIFRQRQRWAKGHLQVCRHVTKPLLINIFKKRCFASYDVMLANIPIVLFVFGWSAFVFLVNLFHLGENTAQLWSMLQSLLFTAITTWSILMLQAIYILIIERKRLIKMTWWRQALLVLTWPLFDVLEVPTKLIALFKDVKWKPISHTHTTSLREIEKATGKS